MNSSNKSAYWWLSLCSAMVLQIGCQSKPMDSAAAPAPAPAEAFSSTRSKQNIASTIHFVDVSSTAGLDFVHTDGSSGQYYMLETYSGGLALADFNNDGLVDVFFCNGRSLEGQPSESDTGNKLYMNMGNLKFRDVSTAAGFSFEHYGLAVAVGDFDNDGFADFFLNGFESCILLRNQGDGTFTDATDEQLRTLRKFGAGACFIDIDGDGGLDLFVGAYIRFSKKDLVPEAPPRTFYKSPFDFMADSSSLWLNNMDGSWTDVSQSSGIGSLAGAAMGVLCGDLDQDGDSDILVANDEMQNYLYLNDGTGVFTEAGFSMGLAVDCQGNAQGSMGIDCGDLDNDGRPEIIVTSYEGELMTLYSLTQQGVYKDVTRGTRIGEGTLPHVTWGCSLADLDNDGDRDVYVASGHLDRRDQNKYYEVMNIVLQNEFAQTGRLVFHDVSRQCGQSDQVFCSRGSAVADLDNDGDLDVVVLNRLARPTILQNTCKSNNWLKVTLIGRQAPRDGVGAKVRIVTDAATQFDEVRSGRGYQSHWGSPLHYGLGAETKVKQIEIHWPGGKPQTIVDVPANQHLTIVQSDSPT